MNKRGFCIGMALILTSLGVAAKEAASTDVNKPYVDPGKRERRVAVPESIDPTTRWQPYLRWHRDASSLQGSNDRVDSLGRPARYTQL
jgi:hypothetical protein